VSSSAPPSAGHEVPCRALGEGLALAVRIDAGAVENGPVILGERVVAVQVSPTHGVEALLKYPCSYSNMVGAKMEITSNAGRKDRFQLPKTIKCPFMPKPAWKGWLQKK